MTALEPLVQQTRLVDVPKTIGEVDARWLTEALSVGDPGLVVESAQILQSLGGACTKLRIAVRTNRPGFPATVIVKGCFEPHTERMEPLQLLEANVYKRVVSRLNGVQTVRTLFVQADEERGSVLILEDLDLRGVRCLRALEPIADFDVAQRFMDVLAALHAHWWNSPVLEPAGEFAWVRSTRENMLGRSDAALSDPTQRADILSRPRGAAVSRMLHDAQRLRRAFAAMIAASHSEPMVLAHGDPHLANLFVDAQGGVGLLDWTCLRAPWALDVTYAIGGCLDVIDRRRWEGALLERYLGQLARCGVNPPGFDDAWLAYQRWHLWGLMIWLTNSTDYHTEAQITAMTARFATAVVDHDTYRLLGI